MILTAAALTAALTLPPGGLTRPAQAVTYALADAVGLPETDRPYCRWMWIPDGSRDGQTAVQFSLNVVSRASRVIRGTVTANGFIVRVDLRDLAPRDGQVNEILTLWDRMAAGDPYFYVRTKLESALPANAKAVPSKAGDPPGSNRFDVDGDLFFRDSNGAVHRFAGGAWVRQSQPANSSVVDAVKSGTGNGLALLGTQKQGVSSTVSAFGGHVDLRQAVMLQGLTSSATPICRYDRACVLMLTTLDGGLYYEFAGIKGDQAQVLQDLGADPALSEKLRSDQRAAVARSEVAGNKPRRIDVIHGAGGTTGFVAITHDITDETNEAAAHPILNLLDFKDDARELIGERSNGFHAFALFDGQGALQRAVPDNVARDHTIPAPHTARLQPAIACIRCHGVDGGLRTFRNDVQAALKGDLDVFGDFSSKADTSDVIDRLVGLYEGDLAKQLTRARDDYADAIFRATGGVQSKAASAIVGDLENTYVRGAITPAVACRELGYLTADETHAIELLRQLLPPAAEFEVGGVRLEDPRIGFLREGIPINRKDFENVYLDCALRASQAARQ